MKNQALLSLKDKSKKLKCRLLQFLFGALRVNFLCDGQGAVRQTGFVVVMVFTSAAALVLKPPTVLWSFFFLSAIW